MFKVRALLLPILLSCFLIPWAVADQAPMTADQVLRLTSLDQHLEELKDGKIVAIGLSEVESDTELRVLMGVLVPASLQDTVTVLQQQSNANGVLMVEEIGMTASDSQLSAVFDKVYYSGEEIEEVKRLLNVTEGATFNFSSEEISLIKKRSEALGKDVAADGKAAKAMSSAMADVLKGRCLAYREKGLDGLDPYQKGSSERANPSRELVLATESMATMEEMMPSYYQCLRFFPKQCAPGFHQQLFWAKQMEGGRPMFSLKHWLLDVQAEYAVITERQFYLNHSLNSLQVVIGCLKHADGTLVVLFNQVFTEKVNVALGKGIAVTIGRIQVEKRVRPMFEHLRAAFVQKKQLPTGLPLSKRGD